MAKEAKKWLVTYYPASGSGWPVKRRFNTERQARAFYKSLWRRADPPISQSITKDP